MSAALLSRPISLTPHQKTFVGVRTVLKVNCGCGASFTNVTDGAQHAEDTGHTLHITGEIRSTK